MISLNILSPDYKKNLDLERAYNKIKDFSFVIVLLASCMLIILLISNVMLQNFYEIYLGQNVNLFNQNKDLFKNIESFNALLISTDGIQANHINWPQIFADLLSLVPANIEIRSLNCANGKISIAGNAKTRDDMIIFADNLKKSTYFNNIKSPITNLFKKEDVDFTLDMDLSSLP